MRRGELMALKWRDINFAAGTLQVRRILTHMPAKLNGKGEYVEVEEVGFEPTARTNSSIAVRERPFRAQKA